jgi:hypothetical protein
MVGDQAGDVGKRCHCIQDDGLVRRSDHICDQFVCGSTINRTDRIRKAEDQGVISRHKRLGPIARIGRTFRVAGYWYVVSLEHGEDAERDLHSEVASGFAGYRERDGSNVNFWTRQQVEKSADVRDGGAVVHDHGPTVACGGVLGRGASRQ